MNNNKTIRLTSIDNPYDPFTHWEQWYLFDMNAGYNTCGRLASVTFLSESMTNKEQNEALEEGMELLIKTGCISKNGNVVEYKKVIKNVQTPLY